METFPIAETLLIGSPVMADMKVKNLHYHLSERCRWLSIFVRCYRSA